MSPRSHNRPSAGPRTHASTFAALGDPTRLSLVTKLCQGDSRSISQLSEGSRMSRQAITKHLRVLENAGIVRNVHAGRESLFQLNPEPMAEAGEYLRFVSEQWDAALSRLKALVED